MRFARGRNALRLSLIVAAAAAACSSQRAAAPENAPSQSHAARAASNPALQRAAEAALRDVSRPSAVVALDPNSGAVRALASIAGERGDPLLTAHIPASTFKVFTSIAALEAGALTPGDEKTCTGSYDFAGKTFTCREAHGRETVVTAITRSCNAFFYDVGAHMEHARLLEMARRFGFGERTGIELLDDAGHVEDAARAAEIRRDPGSPVPLLDAMGHGEIEVTLLQLARAFAAIANGGKLLRMSVSGGGAIERNLAISPGTLATIRKALADVVDAADGTAHDVAITGFPFSGKSGSDDAPPLNGKPSGEDKWFVAYAPRSAPAIVVAARVEHAEGAADAKHVVRAVLEAYRSDANARFVH